GGDQRASQRRPQDRPVGHQRAEDQLGARQHVGGNVADADDHLPGQETQQQHRDGQRHAPYAVRALLLGRRRAPCGPSQRIRAHRASGASGGHAHRVALAAIARARASDARRHAAAYSADVRKGSSRGYGASMLSSAKIRPGRLVITTTRLARYTDSNTEWVTNTTVWPS